MSADQSWHESRNCGIECEDKARLADETKVNKIKVLSSLLKTYKGKLKNNFVVVTESKIRIRLHR
ncbi:hypothetical protein IID22_02245 [Patescibacteria group bacterium]|nr:hypothetical protein [Patescibacteria group bacterium]